MNIESIYCEYLKEINLKRERDKNVFHASSAGSCYRKQLYSYFDFPKEELDKKSLKVLRLGTVVHKDVEEAITKYQDANPDNDIYIEEKVKIPELNVTGTFDYGEFKTSREGKSTFNLYDLKTAAAYKWSTMFGNKENRKINSANNYKLQLATYALAVKERFDPDYLAMYLVFYNKNTSMMRERLVMNPWMDKALEYWVDLNTWLDDVGEKYFEEELIPELTEGVPFENWECGYCSYSEICPSQIKKRK
jgi:hypothetical protein|tara:strand:+ start:1162 stop:1908 length:747 start_codon:yes stop_codon:yes gene_type:complete